MPDGVAKTEDVDRGLCPQEMIVGIERLRTLAGCAFDLGLANAGRNGGDNGFRDSVLEVEDILQQAIVTFGLDMGPGLRIDQLAGHAQAVSGLPDRSFQDITPPSSRPIRRMSTARPLYENDEFRAVTKIQGTWERPVMTSSAMPSAK